MDRLLVGTGVCFAPWDADKPGMKDEPLEDLEYALRERAFAFDAELVVDMMPDGRLRAAFKQFVDPIAQRVGSSGVILLAAEAPDRRAALEALHTLAIG
jgi:hypothetical protein